jgi:hypothetical protein
LRKCVAGLLFALAACGGSSNPEANSCATKGATYLVTFTEVSGNCGPVASQIVNVNPDGTITNPNNITCAGSSVQGCTINNNACTYSSQGYNVTFTTSVTFSSDGASASGLESFSISGAGSCTETYRVSYLRQ